MNLQPPEKRNHTHSNQLDLHSMFPTIQGEGPFVGQPAYFIRLAGCNLQCPGCDTEYTQGRRMSPIEDIYQHVRRAWMAHKLIVITGGEPLRQNILPLIKRFCNGYNVQIETNGTMGISDIAYNNWADLARDGRLSIVCSPKAGKVHSSIERIMKEDCLVSAYKYVLSSDDVNLTDGLPGHALGHFAHPQVARPVQGVPIYLQPMDPGIAVPLNTHENPTYADNLEAVRHSCMLFGYTLGIQMHKIIGVE